MAEIIFPPAASGGGAITPAVDFRDTAGWTTITSNMNEITQSYTYNPGSYLVQAVAYLRTGDSGLSAFSSSSINLCISLTGAIDITPYTHPGCQAFGFSYQGFMSNPNVLLGTVSSARYITLANPTTVTLIVTGPSLNSGSIQARTAMYVTKFA